MEAKSFEPRCSKKRLLWIRYHNRNNDCPLCDNYDCNSNTAYINTSPYYQYPCEECTVKMQKFLGHNLLLDKSHILNVLSYPTKRKLLTGMTFILHGISPNQVLNHFCLKQICYFGFKFKYANILDVKTSKFRVKKYEQGQKLAR